MPLPVSCRCAYLAAQHYPDGVNHVFHASKYIKAIKAETVNGYGWVPVGGIQHRLTQANRDDALRWFGTHAAEMIGAAAVAPPFVLVPIPSSGAAVGTDVVSRTLGLAEAARDAMANDGVKVLDVIRWDEPLLPARRGGPRFADQLYPHVRIVADIERGTRVVLVDDVLTSGGHFQSVRAALGKRGAAVIHGLCAGRTVHEPPADSWCVVSEEVADWTPGLLGLLARFVNPKN